LISQEKISYERLFIKRFERVTNFSEKKNRHYTKFVVMQTPFAQSRRHGEALLG